MELCLRLSRFKKENKELVTYLLFEAHDEASFIAGVKADMDTMFDEMQHTTNLYLSKKSLRKILRHASKHARFSGSKTVEAELLMHFLTRWLETVSSFKRNTVLVNLYNAQLKKIEKAIASLHEDLQYDYRRELDTLRNAV